MIKFNEEYKNILGRLFAKKRAIGVVGNTGTAKSSLVLKKLLELKEENPNLDIFVFGTEEKLKPYLLSKGIQFIKNKEDILDLKIKNSVIFVDEFGDLFSVQARDKQTERIVRFFNRIEHLNDYLIISTARNGFWNKMMNGFINQFLVKEIEYDSLVNNTPLKRKVKGIFSTSDYRLEAPKSDYYVLADGITEQESFGYDENLDSKKDNINPFEKYKDGKISKTDKINLEDDNIRNCGVELGGDG